MSGAQAVADRWPVAVPDLVLLTLNAVGVRSYRGKQRERLTLRLDSRPHETWLVIVAFGQPQSPFKLDGERLLFGDDQIGVLVNSEPDDTSISYFRKDRRVLTLNSNARSRCTGCAFCPNLLEDRADTRLGEDAEMVVFLSALTTENGWSDLSPVECVTVCTGCFSFEPLAIRHMGAVRASLDATGFGGTLQSLQASCGRSEAWLPSPTSGHSTSP